MKFFDSLPKVNKLMVMRKALLEDEAMFARFALYAVMNGHLTMQDLQHAFGRNVDDPNHNPDACNPLK